MADVVTGISYSSVDKKLGDKGVERTVTQTVGEIKATGVFTDSDGDGRFESINIHDPSGIFASTRKSSSSAPSPSAPTVYSGSPTSPVPTWSGGPQPIIGNYMNREEYSYGRDDLTALPNIDTRALLEKARMGTNYMRAVNEGGVLCNLFRTPPVEARNLGAILNAGMPAVPDFSGCTARVIEAPPITPPVATTATPTTPTPPTFTGTPVATTPGAPAATPAEDAKAKAETEKKAKEEAEKALNDAKNAEEAAAAKEKRAEEIKAKASEIAGQIFQSLKGIGTDEEKLKEAVDKIDKDNVLSVMKIWEDDYKGNMGGYDLITSIDDDFSFGGQNDYINQIKTALKEKAYDLKQEQKANAFEAKTSQEINNNFFLGGTDDDIVEQNFRDFEVRLTNQEKKRTEKELKEEFKKGIEILTRMQGQEATPEYKALEARMQKLKEKLSGTEEEE